MKRQMSWLLSSSFHFSLLLIFYKLLLSTCLLLNTKETPSTPCSRRGSNLIKTASLFVLST